MDLAEWLKQRLESPNQDLSNLPTANNPLEALSFPRQTSRGSVVTSTREEREKEIMDRAMSWFGAGITNRIPSKARSEVFDVKVRPIPQLKQPVNPIEVYKNASPAQIIKLSTKAKREGKSGNIRLFTTKDNDIYAWLADDALHGQLIESLGLGKTVNGKWQQKDVAYSLTIEPWQYEWQYNSLFKK